MTEYTEYMLLFLGAVLVNNFVLVQFLGLCPFMGVSSKLESAIGMAGATTFVLTLTAVVTYLAYTWVLVPLDLEYLKTITFIVVIAAVVQFAKMFIEKVSPTAVSSLGCLSTTNYQ